MDLGILNNLEDRVEILNTVGLVSAVPRSEFSQRNASRNPLIFGLFERMRLVEQIDSGITHIRDIMTDEGPTPPEFNIDGMFTVTLRRPFDFEKRVNKWVNNLSEKQIIILTAIHHNSKIKKAALQELADFSATALDNNIDILKKEGVLEREGSKGGVWIIHYVNPKVGE